MNTLSNVDIPRAETGSPSISLTAGATPEATCSQTGVSVRYAHDPEKKWHVLRATYGREQKAFDLITKDGGTAYLPMRISTRLQQDGRKKRIKVPLLPNILFVYSTEEQVEKYVKHTPVLSFLKYYYNRLSTNAEGLNLPLTVPHIDMMNFIKATSTEDENLRIVEESRCRYKSGDRIRVKAGPFEGIEGRVARVAGQQRVIITVKGLCSVATAYIPSAFLEVIR